MPANTPIYAFTYPCPGEDVDPLAFQTLAGQIDTKMNDVNNDYLLALGRRNVDLPITAAGTQVIAAGADTVLTPASSTYTFPAAGIYSISAGVTINAAAATLNMERLRVRQNAVLRFATTRNPGNELGVEINAYGVMVAAAADVLTMSYLFNGTGNQTVAPYLSVKMLCRIA